MKILKALLSMLFSMANAVKQNAFVKVELSATEFQTTINLKETGVISLVLPGIFDNPKDVDAYRSHNISLKLGDEEFKTLFPGHNSFIIKKSSIEIKILVDKEFRFLGKTAYLCYTDEKEPVYPFLPGHDWVTYNLKDRKTIIRMLPDELPYKEFVFTYGFFDNSGFHASQAGIYDSQKSVYSELYPQIILQNVRYSQLDLNVSKESNFHIITQHSQAPRGLFIFSQAISKSFSLNKLSFAASVAKTRFEGISDTQSGNLTWGRLYGIDGLEVHGIKYYYGLFGDRDISIKDYFIAMFNATYGLTNVPL